MKLKNGKRVLICFFGTAAVSALVAYGVSATLHAAAQRAAQDKAHANSVCEQISESIEAYSARSHYAVGTITCFFDLVKYPLGFGDTESITIPKEHSREFLELIESIASARKVIAGNRELDEARARLIRDSEKRERIEEIKDVIKKAK